MIMKNIFNNRLFVSVFFLFGVFSANSQVLTNNGQVPIITNSNVLIDGSTNFSTEAGAGANLGKGVIIPSVDLVNFAFDLTLADGSTFPTYFDGMIVYNNATGTTLTTGNRSATATTVMPGYYYFSNPNGATNANVTNGEWKPLGSSAIKNNNVTDVSATYTALTNDNTLLVNVPSGGVVLTLPDAAANDGKILYVKKVDDDYDALTLSPAVKISASETFTTLNYIATLKLQSDGTNWWLLN